MTPESFTKERFSHGVLLDVSLDEVWSYVATPEGMSKWFLEEVRYTDADGQIRAEDEEGEKGDRYHWKWQKNHSVEGRLLDVISRQRFAFTFGKDFTAEFTLRVQDGRTRLVLTQVNHKPNQENEFGFINCCVCWAFFMTNLKSIAEGGKDLRETVVEEEMLVNQ